MSVSSHVIPAITSEQRWEKWQERGRRHDERLIRRARTVLVLILIAFAVVAFALTR